MREFFFVRCAAVALMLAIMTADPAMGQEARKAGSVPLTFVPPPVEKAVYSLGIYEARSGKLVRRLCEAAGEKAFTVGLNGFITSWDGKDDEGMALPPGKYAARGFAVGPMEVEGLEVLGNEWAADDEKLRIAKVDSIVIVPEDGGLVIAGRTPWGHLQVARYGGEKTEFMWGSDRGFAVAKPTPFLVSLPKGGKFLRVSGETGTYSFRLANGEQATPAAVDGSAESGAPMSGWDGTTWKIEEGVVTQYSAAGEPLRNLAPVAGEPVPVAVASAPDAERIYLLEEAKGWQRVRGLELADTKEQGGKKISSWKTVFERSIRAPDPALGLGEPENAKGASPAVEIALQDNPLSPGKHPRGKLMAVVDAKGSYLATADGLRLRLISERGHLRAARLIKDKSGDGLLFYDTDGAAWDGFSIRGASGVIEFDAGEFEIDAAGEKPNTDKAPEPGL